MANSGNFVVPSDFSPTPKAESTSPTSLPISQICQINLASLIQPSVSSAFSIVPPSSSASSSSSVAAAKRRYSDAEIVLLRLITGREATPPLITTTTEDPLAESESESDGSGLVQSEISLEDRLKKTTSIWFLPESTRTGVTHLLQGKEPGCFIVRNSSKPKSMALSVRLPEGKGPHVEHFLIESYDSLLHLEGSENYFACITTLIAHYCGCCDELPTRLTLPQKLMEANSVKLISYSLLGQDFWHSLSKPAPKSIGPAMGAVNSINNPSFVSHISTNKPTTPESNRMVSQATINTISSSSSNKALHLDYHSHQIQLQGQKQQPINQICLSSTPTASSCSPPSTSSASCLLGNEDDDDIDHDLLGLIEDPLVDVRKSSTVPINIVKSDFAVKSSISPKPPPRSAGTVQTSFSSSSLIVPPPVPSRTSKPSAKAVADSTSKSSSNNSIMSCTIGFSSEEEDSSKLQPFEAQEEKMIDNYVNSNNNQQSLSQKTFENRSIDEISSHHHEDLSQVKLRGEKSPKSIDTLIKYYNSRVEDKYSDYEDIWSFTPKTSDEQDKTHPLVDIEPSKEPPSSSSLPKDVEPRNAVASAYCSTSTQTDSLEPTSSEALTDRDPCTGGDMICRNEHYSHYGSDSNLTMSSCRSSRSRHNLSLESLLNLNNNACSIYNDSTDDGFCRNMFNKLNPQLEDVSIQVGDGRTTASSSRPRNHRNCAHSRAHHHRRGNENGTTASKDSSWLLDSSWKWRRSNEVLHQLNDSTLNTDTDDTTLTLRSPLRRNKRPNSKSDDKRILDQERADLNRYRRFSARYVLESGVESDPENSADCDNKDRNSRTVEDLIILDAPELKVPKIEAEPEQESNTHNDSYDNVVTLRKHDRDSSSRKASRGDSNKTSGGTLTDTETVFSEPWDSEYWRKLISVTPGKTELMLSLSPEEEEEGVSTILDAGGSSTSTGDNENRVKREDSCRSKTAHLSASSFSYSGNRSSQSGDEANPMASGRESLDITEVTSFASDATSDILSSVSMQDQTRISMTSDSSTLIGYKSESTGNERIYSVGKNICNYIFTLVEENDNTFAKSVSHFIDCTKELHETNPHVVMRNMRQFMNGMKNYLVKHGEKNFLAKVKEERNKLKRFEFLNIDAIIEGTLHKLVIKPLKAHLDQLFVEYYKKNGSLQLLSENMKSAQKKSPQELGVRYDLHLPDSKSMSVIQKFFERMQRAYSPLKKLEHLLAAISAIYSGVKSSHLHHRQAASSGLFYPNKGKLEHLSIGADDLLPIFIYVLVHCGFLSAEIEAEYMWGLLHPSLLSGEGGYYLTTLSSCLHVLKNMTTAETESSILSHDDSNATSATVLNSSVSSSPQSTSPPATPSMTGTATLSSVAPSITPSKFAAVSDHHGYMKIMIPNELSCSIVTKTLPVRPNMTTKDVCKMIAHKFNQTNSEDYGLFQITADGDEIQLEPVDLPQTIRSERLMAGQAIGFAYKRIDAKFIWPRMEDQ